MVLSYLVFLAATQGRGRAGNPFAPPGATLHYAPDRTCDLTNVTVDLDVDYGSRGIVGHVVNTLVPLRSGLTEIRLMAGKDLNITSVTVDSVTASFRREDDWLIVSRAPTVRGRGFKIAVDYNGKNTKGQAFGGQGGFHWIEPREGTKDHIGFWTQGETLGNRNWVPTWDYPNDLTTSETRTTVPADWDVVGNGVLVSAKLSADRKKKTYDWKMTLPHATYLLSLAGGPFDIQKDKWEGVDLWYVAPRGEGQYIKDSFVGTKDMLSFYSKILGVKYPWPKYAQDAMYDFGGGMENVSATTLGENSLTEARMGYRAMDSLNSHEMGHQWFGDFVTCKDWGDTWLNESFATYMQCMYFEHSRGQNGLDREVDGNIRSYLAESRRYQRPISTKLYSSPDNMFDSHTYPKGGTVLHMLRRWLGDEAFFAGLHQYLTTYAHQPVESAQLRRAMTEASGINCEPFWAQWFDKPGHPVFDYSWTKTASGASVTLKQTQDTSNGTPIYNMPGKVAFIKADGTVKRFTFTISKQEETFETALDFQPVAAVLDPDHDVLREIPKLAWTDAELPYILQFAPSCLDRTEAFRRLVANAPSDATVSLLAAQVKADTALVPVYPNVSALGELARPELKQLWLDQMGHANFDRAAQAVTALGKLPADPATTAILRGLVNDKAPIPVVIAAIRVLGAWDLKGNSDLIKKAEMIPSIRNRIKNAAMSVLSG